MKDSTQLSIVLIVLLLGSFLFGVNYGYERGVKEQQRQYPAIETGKYEISMKSNEVHFGERNLTNTAYVDKATLTAAQLKFICSKQDNY